MSDSNQVIFSSTNVGATPLANRMVMAPLTRCRAINHQPNEMMAEYYSQRATSGLIITECTMISDGISAFGNEPGIYSEEQIQGWKLTTDAVHKAGGRIFMQIWHAGRACHPLLNNGRDSVAPSAIAIEGETHTPEGKKPHAVPRELTKPEIASIVEAFRQAALNAIAAGFDGVELHGANGYLIDQFLRDNSNHRTDEYGGSLENRVRFMDEVITAVTNAVGSDRVGIRLSPLNSYQSMKDSDPIALTEYLAQHLNQYNLAYVHLMRADFFGVQQGDVVGTFRSGYTGHLMVNMGYDIEEANNAIKHNIADSVAFGTYFLANPDFVKRAELGAQLNTPDSNTFYSSGATGYTDYPTL